MGIGHGWTAGTSARPRRWQRAALAAVTLAVPSLVAAQDAGATSPTSVTPGAVTPAYAVAGANSPSYTIAFTTSATGALGAGATVTFTGPDGTAFSGCSGSCSYTLAVNNSHAATVSSAAVSKVAGPGQTAVSTTNNQVVLTLGTSSIAGGDTVTVTTPSVENPVTAGSYSLAESTSTDTNVVNSPAYNITAGPPASVIATGGDNQSTPASSKFPVALTATVVDSFGNPVLTGLSSDKVLFSGPTSGAGLTFAGTATSEADSIGSNGQATSSVPTANATTGTYTVSAALVTGPSNTPVIGPNNTPVDTGPEPFTLQNLSASAPPPPAHVTPNAVALSNTTEAQTGVTYTIPFRTSSSGALGVGGTITFVAPKGTAFPACTTLCGNYTIAVSNSHGATINTVAVSAASGSSTNNQAVITLLTSTISFGDTVTVTVSGVGNPTLATTQNQMAESTSSDTGVALSPDYTIVHGTPTQTIPMSGDGQTAQEGSQFAAPLVVKVADSHGNGVSGIPVSFAIGSAGSASAAFANTTTTETDQTGPDGLATTSLLTANHNAGGPYGVSVSVTTPSGISPTSFTSLTNTAGQVTPSPLGLGDASAGATNVTYTVGFTTSATGNCPAPCNVTLVAPNGTTFPALSGSNYSTSTGGPSITGVTLSDVRGPGATVASTTPNQAVITLGTTVAVGTYVAITITGVTNPKIASGSYVMEESTTADNTVAATKTYVITPGAPTSVAVNAGNSQSAAPGAVFAQPLRALVTDSNQNPVPNVSVTFTAPASGTAIATATFASCPGANQTANTCTVNTGTDGIATSSALTASTTAGGYSVSAAVTGIASPATFNLTNGQVLTPLAINVTPATAGSTATYTVPFVTSTTLGAIPSTGTCPPCQITLVAPNGTVLPSSVASYQVAASGNHAMTLTDVLVSKVQGPGSATTSSTPNQAVLSFDASSVAGGDTVTVTLTGVTNPTVASDSYTFTESTSSDNSPVGSPTYSIGAGPASTVGVVAGNPQSATVGTAFATPLEVQVLDAYGNPVQGETVTFTIPSTGASGTFATCPGSGSSSTSCVVTSDANGDATALPLTANSTTGAFDVSVSATSTNGPLSGNLPVFQLTNTAGGPSSVSKISGDNQAATVGGAYPNSLQVKVTDQFNNPISGYPITFTAPASGASVTFAAPCSGHTCSVTTNGSGLATSTAMTANTTAGSVTVAVQAGQLQAPSFSLTNNSSAANTMTALANTTPQTTTVGTAFTTPLGVRVTDQYGNPVSGVAVTFTAPASGASGNFSCNSSTSPTCTVTTQSDGTAVAPTFTADGQAGSYTVAATASGLPTQSFALTNTPGSAAVTNFLNPNDQVQLTATNTAFGSPLQIEVTDSFGNPLQGVSVTFTAPDSGPTATFGTCPGGNPTQFQCIATTDANGVATSSVLTANSLQGWFPVVASTPGASDSTFYLFTEHLGYWMVGSDGGVFNIGSAPFYGSKGGDHLNSPIVGMAAAVTGNGYYLVASDGGVFNFGPDAPYLGSEGGTHLNAPIVGIAVDPNTGGYWLAAADGGVFNFGGAPYYGSHGGSPLNKPIVGIAATPNGGYYLVASDGGIFNYGPGATYYGSHGGAPLNQPIVGMAEDVNGDGYYLVASDGGIFNYGPGATYYGSHGGAPLNQPIVGMAVDPFYGGYWLVARDGGIFNYPDAEPFYGSEGGTPLNAPIVGMAPSGW